MCDTNETNVGCGCGGHIPHIPHIPFQNILRNFNPYAKVDEKGDEYIIQILIPGFDREQITLAVKENELFVEAKRPQDANAKKETETDQEAECCGHGSPSAWMPPFLQWWGPHREINVPLGESVEAEGVKAKLSKGILTVTMKKKKPTPINVEE